jgi:hypothetical protein
METAQLARFFGVGLLKRKGLREKSRAYMRGFRLYRGERHCAWPLRELRPMRSCFPADRDSTGEAWTLKFGFANGRKEGKYIFLIAVNVSDR